jgi:hypothetical protein
MTLSNVLPHHFSLLNEQNGDFSLTVKLFTKKTPKNSIINNLDLESNSLKVFVTYHAT